MQALNNNMDLNTNNSMLKYFSSINLEQLVPYVEKALTVASVSKLMAPAVLQDLVAGQDLAGELLARAVQEDVILKSKLSQAESIAYLEKAPAYLQSKSIKDTSEARKQYVEMDSDVVVIREEKAKLEAIVLLLKNKLSVLKQAHDDLKKIHFGESNISVL